MPHVGGFGDVYEAVGRDRDAQRLVKAGDEDAAGCDCDAVVHVELQERPTARAAVAVVGQVGVHVASAAPRGAGGQRGDEQGGEPREKADPIAVVAGTEHIASRPLLHLALLDERGK